MSNNNATKRNSNLFNPSDDDPIKNYQKYQRVKHKTLQVYLKRFNQLCKPFDKIEHNINQLKDKRATGFLMYSTVRIYKASLLFGLSGICTAHENADLLGEFEAEFVNMALEVDKQLAHRLYAEVKEWVENDLSERNSLDNISLLANVSSAYKAKYFDDVVFDRLKERANENKRLNFLYHFINFNLKLGLRPSEWSNAKLVRDIPNEYHPTWVNFGIQQTQNVWWLKVRNGKATFGRACGEVRYLGVDGYGADFIKQLHAFLNYIQKNFGSEEKWDKQVANKSRQLNRFLKKDPVCIKLIQSKIKKTARYLSVREREQQHSKLWLQVAPTLYSTRHQAICDARSAGFDPISIASMFGHVSVDSARIHYGHIKKGKQGKFKLLPHSENIGIVISHLTDYQKSQILEENANQANQANVLSNNL